MKTFIRPLPLMAVALLAGVCTAQPRAVVREAEVEKRESAQSTRASDLLGLELVHQDGEYLGTVKDLVMDNAAGQVQYVVVEDDRGDYRGIPWKALGLYQGEDRKDRYFILGMEQERYLKAPAIPQKEWETFSGWTTYAPQVTKYYSDVRPARVGPIRRAARRAR